MSERRSNSGNPSGPELYLATGRPDDGRAALRPGDEHYDDFAWAYAQQEAGWSAEAHEAFWRGQRLNLWPTSATRGPQSRHEGLAEVAEYARNVLQATPGEIATLILHFAPDTVRRRGFLKDGEALASRNPNGSGLGTPKADALAAAPRAPVIYTGVVAPRYVLTGVVPPAEPHPDVTAAWERADALRREWWASGELTHHGRRGDVAGFVEANRRMWLHDGESVEDFPAHVKDAVDRGKWPVTALDYV